MLLSRVHLFHAPQVNTMLKIYSKFSTQGISDVGRAPCPSPPPGTLTEDDLGIAKREQKRQNSRASTTGSLDGEFIPEEDDHNAHSSSSR